MTDPEAIVRVRLMAQNLQGGGNQHQRADRRALRRVLELASLAIATNRVIPLDGECNTINLQSTAEPQPEPETSR